MAANVCIFFFVLLFRSLSHAAPVSNSLVVLVKSPIVAKLHQSTTLPCWLNPAQNAESLEVRWYSEGKFDTPILLFQGRKFVESPNSSYTGRTSFGLKDATSGGLTTGDVSLELRDITLQDRGLYTCYVSSEQGYDSTSVELKVIARGSRPVLKTDWVDDKVNMSCETAGWFPQPQLRWSDNTRTLSPGELWSGKDQSGLMWVRSWILVPANSEVTCAVDLSVGEKEDAHLQLGNPPQPKSKGSPAAGWVAFALLLLAVGVALGVMHFKKRGFVSGKTGNSSDGQASPEGQALLQSGVFAEVREKHYANVTLDETENQCVVMKDQKVRDKVGSLPDGDLVNCLTAVKGTPGFTCGKHYWEVSMGKGDDQIPVKESWWVGVTTQTSFPLSKDALQSKSSRFWFLASSPTSPDCLQLNNVFLKVDSKPKLLGVFLNYEGGELSFFDAEKERLICTLKASFGCEVFAFFNPGRNDKAPMEIMHRQAPTFDAENTNAAGN